MQILQQNVNQEFVVVEVKIVVDFQTSYVLIKLVFVEKILFVILKQLIHVLTDNVFVVLNYLVKVHPIHVFNRILNIAVNAVLNHHAILQKQPINALRVFVIVEIIVNVLLKM